MIERIFGWFWISLLALFSITFATVVAFSIADWLVWHSEQCQDPYYNHGMRASCYLFTEEK